MSSTTLNQMIVPRCGGFEMKDYWVWCPSVIAGDDGRYHMFASRWPKWLPFHPGWLTNSQVVRAVADQPQGPYEFQEVVLPARGAEYWDGRSTHNPRIVRGPDGFLLYYTGMTHPFAEPVPETGQTLTFQDPRCVVSCSQQRVGLAIAPSLTGPWRRLDKPIVDVEPGTFYSCLTANPSPVLRNDGSVFLIFKSRQFIGHTRSAMYIGAATAEHYESEYRVVTRQPLFGPDHLGEIEDPFVWWHNDEYHLIAKDMSGTLCGEFHAGLYAVSRNGLQWELGAPRKAYSRAVTWDDGQSQILGQMERPSLFMDAEQSQYLFAAVGDGPGGFDKMTRSWNIAIPLRTLCIS